MTDDPWRVAADGFVEMDTIMLVEGTIRERNCIAWPVVSNRKSTEPWEMISVGSCFV
jgi:hypothetical protein